MDDLTGKSEMMKIRRKKFKMTEARFVTSEKRPDRPSQGPSSDHASTEASRQKGP